MAGRIAVALVALSAWALIQAQSAQAPQGAAPAQTVKTSPAPAEKSASADNADVTGKLEPSAKPERAGKLDVGGKLELHDIDPPASAAAHPPVLKNAGPISTEDVARGVARELAKQDASQTNGPGADPAPAKTQGARQSNSKVKTPVQDVASEPASSSDAVVEFQPAPSSSGAASKADSAGIVRDGAKGKSLPKRVHGDLYGETGAAGHTAGGSVGATSRSGKTSVYIQSDEAGSKVDQPQP